MELLLNDPHQRRNVSIIISRPEVRRVLHALQGTNTSKWPLAQSATDRLTLRPEYISLQDAAVLYAVSVDLLRERIRTGEIPAVHAGRRLIRVRLEDLRRMFRPLPAARKYRQTA